jgi:Phosphotransferase enzyme family
MDHLPHPPYYAYSASLPEALPTEAQIKGSNDILSDCGGRITVRVGHHFVVKYGDNVDVIEAQNMIFVRAKTDISVPKVYAMFTSANGKTIYIIMEYIHGSTLLSEWPAMSELQKQRVCMKIKSYFEELRQIPSPGYYGSLGHGHLPNGMFWTGEGANRNPTINGPFQTESALNEALVQKYKLIAYQNGRQGYKAEFYKRSLLFVFKKHEPMFTHGDFQRKNVIVRRIPTKKRVCANAVDDYHVTIIDWEMAGWYPTYWEYCFAALSFIWDDDWPSKVEKVLRPYWIEYPWIKIFFDGLWS